VGIIIANDLLVTDRFGMTSQAAIAAAAERGDAQAQLHMLGRSVADKSFDECAKWVRRVHAQGNSDANLWIGLMDVRRYLANEKDGPERDELKNIALERFRDPADRGLATAQYTLGMILYCSHCDSGTKADLLDAARWIRKAVMQGFMDAQYDLGEMFRHGVFCDHIYMKFARKYIRRASVQGHVEAIACMKELRSCVMCGADDAKLACSLCHQARYCDSWCSEKHWREGGGVGGGVSGSAGARHKDTCPRTHAR
jgi:TPR repeat protein